MPLAAYDPIFSIQRCEYILAKVNLPPTRSDVFSNRSALRIPQHRMCHRRPLLLYVFLLYICIILLTACIALPHGAHCAKARRDRSKTRCDDDEEPHIGKHHCCRFIPPTCTTRCSSAEGTPCPRYKCFESCNQRQPIAQCL